MAISAPETITEAHDVSAFSCGKPVLDVWLRSRALSNQKKGFSAVVVVHERARVIGYYGLAPTAIAPALVSRAVRTGQPPDPLPCILLGQLAVDANYTRRGIAEGLLKHAYHRCLAATELIAGRALIVRALDTEVAGYWRRRGFLTSAQDPLLLFRSFADIADAIARTERKS